MHSLRHKDFSHFSFFFFMCLQLNFFVYVDAMSKEELVGASPKVYVPKFTLLNALLEDDFERATNILETAANLSELLKEGDAFGNTPLLVAAKLLAKHYSTNYGPPPQQLLSEKAYSAEENGELSFDSLSVTSDDDPWDIRCEQIENDEKLQSLLALMRLLIEKGAPVLDRNYKGKNFLNYLADAKAFIILDPFLKYLDDDSRSIFLHASFPAWVKDVLVGELPSFRGFCSPDILRADNVITLMCRIIDAEMCHFLTFLIDNGVSSSFVLDKDIHYAVREGTTPLHRASNQGKKKIIEVLVSKSADRNYLDQKKQTPLHIASDVGHLAVVEILVSPGEGQFERSPDVNVLDEDGQSPLIKAVIRGHKEIVQLLLSKGAEPRGKDKSKMNALDYARKGDNEEIVKMLEKYFTW